ncbi:MAG: hypothetical protein JW729_03390 [Bacteroidales bacterium]|nr:hypothetical protein [Bacteroidales bacterium]
MRKTIRIVVFLLFTISFTSCIEIVEEIHVNKNLSGSYRLYLKNNGMAFLFNAMSDNLNTEELEKNLNQLKNQEGISNFEFVLNPKKGQFSVGFDFKNTKSLNRAFYTSFGVKKRFYHKNYLTIRAHKVTRPNFTPYLLNYADSQNIFDQIPQKLLDYVDYRYRLVCPNPINRANPSNQNNTINTHEFTQVIPLKKIYFEHQSTKSIVKY